MEGHFHFTHLTFTFLLLSVLQCLVGAETNITTDESALMALKKHVTSDPYGVLANWSLSSPVCSWVGVRCGARHRRVSGLNISNMGLTGVIPPHLGNLSFLVSVDMRFNYFIGTLPEELSRLRRLRFIRLGYNSFTGPVRSWFSLLPRLQLLSLRNNSFTSFGSWFFSSSNNASMMSLEILDISFNSLVLGHIPQSIGNHLPNLKELHMIGNGLSGSIPSSITNMTNLETLNLRNNLIQGTIPEGIGNLGKLSYISIENNELAGLIPLGIFNISTLEILAFSHNSLSGPLPDDMCVGLPLLQGLYLSGNWLNGHIPSSLSLCHQLQTLSLSFNNFTGTIPPDIGSLEMLEILYLGYNELTGPIPSEIGKLQNLQFLALEKNFLRGPIPSSIFNNISSLQLLSLAGNRLNGPITQDIGNLTMLKELYLGLNHFTGVMPGSITQLRELEILDLRKNRLTGQIPSFNISTLRVISLSDNSLSGNLQADVGAFLPNLAEIYLGQNDLDGPLPNSILNSSELIILDLSVNKFSGTIPNSLGNLQFLQVFNLRSNNFTSESTELSFITSLSNSKQLRELSVSYNPLNGTLPPSLGNLSSFLDSFLADSCNIKGNIPTEIGNLSGLVSLSLHGNELTGFFPTTLHGLSNLQGLYLGNNRITGIIPNDLCKSKNLGFLSLSKNQLTGSIPECLGNVSALREISLDSNNLTSGIPASIWDLQDLLVLNISSNSFTGSLSPDIGNLKVATLIDLSMNRFSNDIPTTFGDLQTLANLSLAYNGFQGPIPESIGNMLNLMSLDLSHNKLSGNIPNSLEKLMNLEYLNVSFNELSGQIPTDGPFNNFTSQSFLFNTALCGPSRFHVSSCPESAHTSKKNKVLVPIFILLGIGILISIVTIAFIMIRNRRRKKMLPTTAAADIAGPARISYYELLQATDGYGENNLLGRGSFGSVYKGVLQDGTTVAVKVIDMLTEGALRTFDAECEVLRNLRHRNLTKVISSCSNQDFRAIVLEYMPNGSLEKWLHSDNYFLDTMQRFNILMDVGNALEYLHHGYSTPVVHCDLKPGNILIDEQMVGHVSDFGMTRFLSEEESITHTRTLATLGYMAPEYGSEGVVSTRCDVYSFGIVLLETFTRRRPSDEMFGGEMSIKKWVQDSLANNALSQVIDADLISQEGEENLISEKLSCLSCVLDLGLSCLADSPGDRMSMKGVVAQLSKVKPQSTANRRRR